MELFYLLLVINIVSGEIQQTCQAYKVHEIVHQNKFLFHPDSMITCLPYLSLQQCALECLLVKMCKSLTYRENGMSVYQSACELSRLNLNDVDKYHLYDQNGCVYIDIRDWPKEVAGTCASRPCAENQRCIPTTPYRCIDVDCGTPPVRPVSSFNTDMYPLPSPTSLGYRVKYKCRDENKTIVTMEFKSRDPVVPCMLQSMYSLCNSDFSWGTHNLVCVTKV